MLDHRRTTGVCISLNFLEHTRTPVVSACPSLLSHDCMLSTTARGVTHALGWQVPHPTTWHISHVPGKATTIDMHTTQHHEKGERAHNNGSKQPAVT